MTAPELPSLPEPLTMSLLASSSDREFTADQLREYAMLERLAERERCAMICDEMGEHWSGYKDTALLNGDVALSNAASGEPRAAKTLADLIRAQGEVK